MALFDDNNIRKIFYKLDVSFIHIHSFIAGYAWHMQINKYELLYHILCILYIKIVNIISCPRKKQIINVLCGIGVAKSSYGLIYHSEQLWYIAMFFWIIGFIIHVFTIYGKYSSTIFHLILLVPQLCIMYGSTLSINRYV
jgi:hypothetical protein